MREHELKKVDRLLCGWHKEGQQWEVCGRTALTGVLLVEKPATVVPRNTSGDKSTSLSSRKVAPAQHLAVAILAEQLCIVLSAVRCPSNRHMPSPLLHSEHSAT